ncbi:hypothetical protein FB566_1597 [Stackebrandtia endophytica]|uniref:Uncharacterized protein n=1 Tax=Stackebrandtia endophytica TaxID=1496996 RepID=A0A543AU20_9ACTN|nr:hypothetical protein [Stackebrandtia endophytica]TQL76077.1 hypothetical protein FB566_1597 [Stackebrandtia endophytica]
MTSQNSISQAIPAQTATTRTPANSGPVPDNLATRHLCAATYIDDKYQEAVISRIYAEPHHAIAPYAGVDASVVINHAKRAQILSLVQAGIILGLLLLLMLVSFDEFMITVYVLATWQFIAAGFTFIKNVLHYMRGSESSKRQMIGRLLLIGVSGPFGVLVMIVWAVIVGVPMDASNPSSYGQSLGTTYEPNGLAFVFLLFIIGTVLTVAAVRRHQLVKVRTGDSNIEQSTDSRLDRIRTGQYGDVVNYSDFTPFVGSGVEVRTWQFAMTLHPKGSAPRTDGTKVIPFTTDELTDHIREAMAKLAQDTSTPRLPNLHLSDQAFVSGKDTVFPTQFTGELRYSNLLGTIKEIQRKPTTPIRHFLKCQIASWNAEVVTTIFVHAAVQGETLYMEFSSYLLPPTLEAYHVFDDPRQIGGLAVVLDMGRSLRALPRHVMRSPVVLAKFVKSKVKAHMPQPPTTIVGSRDHGARTSVRDLGTDLDLPHYFQRRDAIKYSSILEAQLLESITEFLKDKVDVSELAKRAETIINAGVVNTGPVYTAAQGTGSTGYVAAQGPWADGEIKNPSSTGKSS